jgi:hypothetical protein
VIIEEDSDNIELLIKIEDIKIDGDDDVFIEEAVN